MNIYIILLIKLYIYIYIYIYNQVDSRTNELSIFGLEFKLDLVGSSSTRALAGVAREDFDSFAT